MNRLAYSVLWHRATQAFGHEPTEAQWHQWLALQGRWLPDAPTFYSEWPAGATGATAISKQ